MSSALGVVCPLNDDSSCHKLLRSWSGILVWSKVSKQVDRQTDIYSRFPRPDLPPPWTVATDSLSIQSFVRVVAVIGERSDADVRCTFLGVTSPSRSWPLARRRARAGGRFAWKTQVGWGRGTSMEEPTGGAALHGEPRGHFLTLTAVLHERARSSHENSQD